MESAHFLYEGGPLSPTYAVISGAVELGGEALSFSDFSGGSNFLTFLSSCQVYLFCSFVVKSKGCVVLQ
eukprot:CAMPEP_0204903406 /NCGR_PEP_ID=MMETSP1397-20131031/4234_1 /ASSEMBLY_ACC=CAM_ASM_000891 /TAXON_ID=49980 /ORGANISM="Climacostomum Climacostomum virens, Strain Stock W-24" /LENGTH=68 /DNA_ID=CAMNT_0052072029 /DNA_START=91 /DNA_END=294 /DNA_ORIENTATION=-